MNSKILVCCHKSCSPKESNVYVPIQLGKSVSNVDLGYLKDDTGDNISSKNPYYSELTAMYWMWKNENQENIADADYVGIAHYRRYLKIEATNENISKYMNKYDILLGNPWIHSFSNLREFTLWEPYEYLLLLTDEILKQHPEYKESIADYFFHSNKWYRCNVFVMKRDDYNRYCEWMFPILFEVESKIEKTQFSRLNRVMGYLGEIMLGLYVEHNKMKKKTFEFELTESIEPSGLMFIHDTLANIAFFITEKVKVAYNKIRNKPYDGMILDAFVNGLKADGFELKYLRKAYLNR